MRATKTRGVSEQEFSTWFGKTWQGFGCRVEPGLGGDTGNPDWFIQPDCITGMVGVELKLGQIKGNRLYSDEVRPSQISWHSRLARQGGISLFLVYTSDGIFAVDGCYANQWENGYLITGGLSDGAYQLSNEASTFSTSLETFIDQILVG